MYDLQSRATDRVARPDNPIPPRYQSRVAMLERRAPRLVRTADRAGVDIAYLGVTPLFREPRAYAGAQTDWVVAPLDNPLREHVPVVEQRKLSQLVRAGIDFPLLFVAHEVPKGQLALDDSIPGQPQIVDQRAMAIARATTPTPLHAVETSQRLGHSAGELLGFLGKALPVLGAVAVAPLLLAGAVLSNLDPMIFGVQPAGAGRPGEPAAWYLLARWDW